MIDLLRKTQSLLILLVILCELLSINTSLAVSALPEYFHVLPDYFYYQIPFPTAPNSVFNAKETLPARIDAVTRFLACGKEITFMRQMLDPNPKARASEDFLTIVLAKLAWLQITESSREPCVQRLRVDAAIDLKLLEWGPPTLHPVNQPRPSETPILYVDRLNSIMKSAFGGRCITNIIKSYNYTKEIVSQTNDHTDFADIFEINMEVSRECLRWQVNAALNRVEIYGQLGTSDLPCGFEGLAGAGAEAVGLGKGKKTIGEWDVSVRDLTRILYFDSSHTLVPSSQRHLSQRYLDDDTYLHVRDYLLSASGPGGDSSYEVYACGDQEQSTGTPQDLADERDWLPEALNAIGDFFKWLAAFIAIVTVVGAALYFVVGLAFAAAIPLVIAGGLIGGTLVRIPETENHQLMIESSRYLKNQLIIEALGPKYDNVDKYYNDQKGIKDWLLGNLRRYVIWDFVEYNARPYQRYSINAILNLADFAKDDEIRLAAQMALEYANAKFAIGSLNGQRIVPFRRRLEVIRDDVGFEGSNSLSGNDSTGKTSKPRFIFDLAFGGDHQVAQMLLFAGQTQNLPREVLPSGQAGPVRPLVSIPSAGDMIYAATSDYRPDDIIIDLAIRKTTPLPNKVNQIYERIHHYGWEAYSSGAGYLLTAGGIMSDFSYTIVGHGDNMDLGAAMPTTLMLDLPGLQMKRDDFIRFEGITRDYGKKGYSYDDNLCVWQGFACGINMRIPQSIVNCQIPGPTGSGIEWKFLDTWSSCIGPVNRDPPDRRRVFVAFYEIACSNQGSNCKWGTVEVASAQKDDRFDDFVKRVVRLNPRGFIGTHSDSELPDNIPGLYHTQYGSKIEFNCRGNHVNSQRWGIESVNGVRQPDVKDWPAAEGDVITKKYINLMIGRASGIVEIKNADMGKTLEFNYPALGLPQRISR